MQDDVVHYAGPAGGARRRRAATSRPSTPPRWCASRYETTAVGHHDRPGPRPGLRGGAALRRADARPQRARRRRGGPGRGRRAGRGRLPDGRQPPQPARGAVDGRRLGRRPADALRLDAGHPGHPADGGRSCSACRSPTSGSSRTSSAADSASKAMVWPHVTLTAMAARHVGRPVKLMLTRPQMFTSNGHREEQEQRDHARRHAATAG